MPKPFEVAKRTVATRFKEQHADDLEEHSLIVAMADIAESMTKKSMQSALKLEKTSLRRQVAEHIQAEMEAMGGRRTRKHRMRRRKTRRYSDTRFC